VLLPKSVFSLVSIADCLSITNALFGFIAIFFLLTNIVFVPQTDLNLDLKFRLALTFILLAILIDGLDGIVARKTKQSELGEYLESMADMTSLAIAPSIFIFIYYFGNRTCCVNC
jgi:CDP-diacylglycerol--serine O-phosphatidyltransferase